MSESIDKLELIKECINKRLKIANVEFTGVKSENIDINIQPVLQNLSKEISIPISEKFYLFNFDNVKQNIKTQTQEPYRSIELQRIDDLEGEYKKYLNLIYFMRKKENIIQTNYICGTYKWHKIIYSRDIKIIKKFNEEVQIEKKKINKEKFGEGVTACCESFRYEIRGELKRHNIKEEEKGLSENIEKCLKGVKNSNVFLEKFKIICEPIMDISKELLTDIKFINSINRMKIDNEDKKLIRDYYNIIKS